MVDRKRIEDDLGKLIDWSMDDRKTSDAVKAIDTLSRMKGWTKGDDKSGKNTLTLVLDDVPRVTLEALGIENISKEKIELYEKLGGFYAKNYKK